MFIIYHKNTFIAMRNDQLLLLACKQMDFWIYLQSVGWIFSQRPQPTDDIKDKVAKNKEIVKQTKKKTSQKNK